MKLFNVLRNFSQMVKNRFNHEKDDNQHRKTDSKNYFDRESSAESYFDGMGLVTATEIIKERIDENTMNECGIDKLENKGRYYLARVSEEKGSISHTVLIDKQNGMVRSLCRKPTMKPIH
ncbi:hypothetical protein KQH27_00245 [bacterium]|nr:hypothetical protein [bacterium]